MLFREGYLYKSFYNVFRKHSHNKRKDSLEDSLDRVLFAAEFELPEMLVPGCYLRMVKTTKLFICNQLLGALIHLNFIILILIWL